MKELYSTGFLLVRKKAYMNRNFSWMHLGHFSNQTTLCNSGRGIRSGSLAQDFAFAHLQRPKHPVILASGYQLVWAWKLGWDGKRAMADNYEDKCLWEKKKTSGNLWGMSSSHGSCILGDENCCDSSHNRTYLELGMILCIKNGTINLVLSAPGCMRTLMLLLAFSLLSLPPSFVSSLLFSFSACV